ncbi:hypothetical protein PG996_005781 [Apiospora saccharicola]|uniref:Transcription factor domain-containing protein n=1 Tax=Apiospora saccharicola TaxID=335842 RepID=A0ABR1VMF6_9PEZI
MREDDAEVLELLQSIPEQRAIDILRLFRTTGDSAKVLYLVKGSVDGERDRFLQDATRTMPTPDLTTLELELMSKNSVAYPQLRRVSVSELEERNLLRPFNLARTQVAEETNASESLFPKEYTMGTIRVDVDAAAACIRAQGPAQQLPERRGKLCDERLNWLDIGFWTKVPIPSDYAAKIISLYIEIDHPLLGTFDPNLFVSDLVGYQYTFCSSLMVNALLYWGCQMYTATDQDANQYTDQFGVEAERLWDAEMEHDSPLDMVSAQLLSLAFMGRGKDHKVLHFLAAAVQIGTRLGLFGVDEDIAKQLLQTLPESLRSASSFIAWGIFNWAVLVSFFYKQPGVEIPKQPPTLPIPGDSGAEDHQDLHSDGAVSDEPIALHSLMGVTFSKICEFWRIVHEVSLANYDHQAPTIHKQLRLDFTENKYREILAWAENLPPQLVCTDDSPHHVITFHSSMWIHSVILDLFRPLLDRQDPEHMRLKTFSAPDSSPTAAYIASVNQLKQLIIQFRSKYESSICTMLWHTALMYVANAVLQDTDDSQWLEYLLLCIYGYETLRRHFRVAETIGRGLLTMALRNKNINSEDACNILGCLQEQGLGHANEGIRATFMGDLQLAHSNPEAATMERLASNFHDMVLFQDFIHSDSEDMV